MSDLNENRVKFARHLLNYKAIESELANYNLEALQKSANAGTSQEARTKYAALLRQTHIEKAAVVKEAAGILRALGSLLGAGARTGSNLVKRFPRTSTAAGIGSGAYLGSQLGGDGPGVGEYIKDKADTAGKYVSNLGNIGTDLGEGFSSAFGRLFGQGMDGKKSKSSGGFALRPSQRKPIYYRANKADL